MNNKIAKLQKNIFLQIVMIFLLFITVYPLFFMFSMSLKPSETVFENVWMLPTSPVWRNYLVAWRDGVGAYFFNSVVVTSISVACMTFVSTLGGYVFARMRIPAKNLLFLIIPLTMTLPVASIVIPLILVMKETHWLNTYAGLIVPYIALGIPLGTIVMRGFFTSLPYELEEAARIDGCSEFGIFWRIMLPLSIPGISTLIIFNFIWVWSEFLWAFLSTSNADIKTLPIGFLDFQSRWIIQWGPLMAALSIIVIPMLIVYLVFQRRFVKGLSAGALKF